MFSTLDEAALAGALDADGWALLPGLHGDYRVTMRHGVSRILTGTRHALGIIFHDAARGDAR